jgi:hypothetical protein
MLNSAWQRSMVCILASQMLALTCAGVLVLGDIQEGAFNEPARCKGRRYGPFGGSAS